MLSRRRDFFSAFTAGAKEGLAAAVRLLPTMIALMTALAATVGTGNIVGVATALTAGGPGALVTVSPSP